MQIKPIVISEFLNKNIYFDCTKFVENHFYYFCSKDTLIKDRYFFIVNVFYQILFKSVKSGLLSSIDCLLLSDCEVKILGVNNIEKFIEILYNKGIIN